MNLIEQIRSIAQRQQLVSVLSQLIEIEAIHNEHEFLDVVILGQFKAGKSSFINNLLGNELLPTGVLPVTAIITRISYGNEPLAMVTHYNGDEERVNIDSLHEYISEKSNPKNEKQVAVVDIFVPEMKNFKPVRLVDTPGLGSVFTHNTEVTNSWLGKIKAAIVVISAAQPLSEHDIELIKQATGQSPKVFILISKTDVVAEQELAEINAFIKIRLQEHFDVDFPIFPYSVNKNDEKCRQTILNKIIIPLAAESDTVQQQVYNHKLNFLVKKTIGYLNISLKTVQQKDEEREKLKSQIVDETLNLKYIKRDLSQIGTNYKEATRDVLKKLFLKKHAEDLTKNLSENLAHEFDSWKGNLAQVTRQYELWIKETMIKAIKEVELQEWENIANHATEAYRHFNSYLTSFRERLNQNIKKVLGIDMPASDIEIEASPIESPQIHISRTFDSHIDMLWFFIPMSVFRKAVKKHFLKEVPFETEKNSYRLISQLNDTINKVIDEIQFHAMEYVEHELESLSATIDTHKSDKQEIEKMIETLTKELTTTGAL